MIHTDENLGMYVRPPEPRAEVRCAGQCGRVLFRAAGEDDDCGDFSGYTAVLPFVVYPYLMRRVSETTDADGMITRIVETPETCLEPACLVAVVHDTKWARVDLAVERAERKARRDAARALRVPSDVDHEARMKAGKPLEARILQARRTLHAILGLAGEHVSVSATLGALARYTGDRAALNAALLEFETADAALRAFWNRP